MSARRLDPILSPATQIVAEPAVDPAGRAVIALALHGPRGGLVFILDQSQAAGFAGHLASLVAALLAAPPAVGHIDTPAGRRLVREV